MKKQKEYIRPTMEILHVELNTMLATSPGVSDGSGLGEDWDEGDVTYSRDQQPNILDGGNGIWDQKW